MSVRVEADPGGMPGRAVIRVAGGAGSVGQPGFRVQRDAGWGDDKLGPGGWQSSDALLQPDRAEVVGRDLVLHVGWGVCRHLEAGIFEVSVPGAGQEAVGVYWPEIVPVYDGDQWPAGGQGPGVSGQETAAATVVNAEPVVEEATVVVRPKPVPVPEPNPIPPRRVPPPVTPYTEPLGKQLLGFGIAGLVLLLLLAGGGAYWWLHRPAEVVVVVPEPRPDPVIVTPPVPPPVVPPVPPVTPVGLGGMSVPDVLAKAPDVAAITAEGRRRLQGDRKDDGLLLLEAAADRGDAAAAAALGRLYDPVLFQPGGPIPKSDPRQAARYYRDAARGGVDVASAREALRQRLQSQSGDLGAKLILGDFWP